MSEAWHVYLIRCADGSLYTGVATDVQRRLNEHQAGRGAKYLRGRGPLELVYSQPMPDHGAALREEARIKRLSKARKQALIAG
ncbi:MAG: GIY-YIG nuclease superfamily protein [Deltaproteobacteria bacterium ADurb.Bin510]|jgi:putative endonuclease|nr:MAG: GIY-YIG nuclease superfamily protein [Deltaproteobacteria bacterium ADurb.Bin510]